ncbi:uncharacterized protein Tco025E_03133 [Trypanosoma conorhini]|uniref:Uncharacterized protein n=1 Tax=Trypanosoma conorhini TaxID=83891 RepID=A0A3R7L9B0_9TRYP|nr:uncharacterized protein Tco025E_03133 [Trypanosoma conorhini]RNF22461.1 hypothetical protein Tco025E_03133 [Trypanosoma conorhini]
MCQVGNKSWIFTDSESCFVGKDLRLYQCTCPISTCDVTPMGNECRFTTPFLVFCGLLFAIWLLAVVAYVHVSGLVLEHRKSLLPDKSHFARGGYYYDKLFGSEKRKKGALAEDTSAELPREG